MKMACKGIAEAVACTILFSAFTVAQAPYQPKFRGDPARSDSEAAALGYMRTVLRAQRLYNRKNSKYATSLMELVHTGSFTRRMVNSEKTASFTAKKTSPRMRILPR